MSYFETFMKYVVGGGLFSLVGLAGLLYTFQTNLIYPANVPEGSRKTVSLPSEFGMDNFDDLTLTAPDQTKLRAYVITHGETAAGRPTILMLHANAGNMGHRLPIAKIFYQFGYNIMLLSYRGYGFSEGSPNEKGIRMDAQTALDHILSHPQLENTKVFLYGQSIGGAVAVDLAHRNMQRVHGIIIENTFLSLPDLVPKLIPVARPFLFLLHQKWDTRSFIDKVSPLPILFLSGRKDTLIPPSHMDELFAACDSKDKIFKTFSSDHNDTCIQPGYFDEIRNFVSKHK